MLEQAVQESPEDPTTVDVWFEENRVGGIMVAEDGALAFSYDPRWLSTRGAMPISVTMPLRPESYGNEVIAPWIANLLPEEEQLRVLTRSLGLDQTDSLAVLSAIGGDTAGALSFRLPAIRTAWSYRLLTDLYGTEDEGKALHRHFDDLGRRPFLQGEDGVRQSLAGGQKKSALAVLDAAGNIVLRLPGQGDRLAVPLNGAPSTLIVKPDNDNLPGIVENEVYCLHLAEAIGIKSASSTILKALDRTAFGVLRYDRTSNRSGIRRVHQEDFAQANGLPPGRKYEKGTVPGMTLVGLLSTGRYVPPTQALELLDQVIFNILVANTDAHAKNYSLLHRIRDGSATLAPLYDVSSVLGWDHVNQYYAQKIAGSKRKPGDVAAAHWDKISEEAGYRAADTRARVHQLVDRMIASRVRVTQEVQNIPGALAQQVEETAALIEGNVLRIAGRLR